MPHISLRLYAGRTEAEKARIADALAKALIESSGASEASVSVSVEDVDPADWPQVYHEITARPELLVRKPGYAM